MSHRESPALRVLAVEADAAARSLQAFQGLTVTRGELALAGANDVVLIGAAGAAAMRTLAERPGLPELAHNLPVVVVALRADDEAEAELLRLGVQAVVATTPLAELVRALRQAYRRKELERAARTAYATDLATGLPHRAQLLEHMNHLLALREREEAPLVLIVLRIEGVAQAPARLGTEAANVLRRKVAVRLRSCLRASDVVASLPKDMFGVLLGRVDAVADGDSVAAKLLRALQEPFSVAGQSCQVGAAFGLASFPAHGRGATALLERATAQAGMMATVGERGVAMARAVGEPGRGLAANDEG